MVGASPGFLPKEDPPASSHIKETAFNQDEVMYSHPFDGGPIPPANRRRAASLPAYSRPMLVDSSSSDDESLPPLVTDSSSESLPPLVESSSSGSATIMLDDSSSSDDSATLGELRHKLFQPKKSGGKDCER